MSEQRYCTSCGQSIPDSQGSCCSACYGDPYYGRDGYLLAMMEREQQEQDYKRQMEESEVAGDE